MCMQWDVYTPWFQYMSIKDAVYTVEFVSASVDLCNYLCVYTMTPVKVCNCVCAEGVYNDFCSYLNSTAVVYAHNEIAVYVILSCMECHTLETHRPKTGMGTYMEKSFVCIYMQTLQEWGWALTRRWALTRENTVDVRAFRILFFSGTGSWRNLFS